MGIRDAFVKSAFTATQEWDELFDDTTITVAAIDRLVHHATMIHFTGDSYRKKEALETQQNRQ
ncbi:hypothetical protein CJ230_04855 [Oligella urethralis]|uniref:ATP-binding protein n=1 Tax=Oligella urethralis TaxID=90245 RepID=UPI000C9B31E4|nr:ATP-binding protein [Oligella urethralis]PMC17891.1 hypothetical protein CJ230_04855 [Oligella urethralis]